MELTENGINWESAFYRQQENIDSQKKVIKRLHDELKDCRAQMFVLKNQRRTEPKHVECVKRTGKYCEACPNELTTKDVNGRCKNCR